MNRLFPLTLLIAIACDPKGDDTGPTEIDADADGFLAADDCDDGNAAISPDAVEVCDGIDNNCDGNIDDADSTVDLSSGGLFYRDADGDGFGDLETERAACAASSDEVTDDTDCDDGNAAISPDAVEVCDSIDNNCDGNIDDADSTVDLSSGGLFYLDADGDGFGDLETERAACTASSNEVADGTDCDDGNDGINPLAAELCDGLDTDCDPTTGEAGLAYWSGDDGSHYDATSVVSGGVEVTLDKDGQLLLCEGTWPVRLTATASVDIIGMAGPELSIVDGGDQGSTIAIEADGVTVNLEDIGITGGAGEGSIFSVTYGGGVRCEADATLTMHNVDIFDNNAGMGAGAMILGCDTEITESAIRDNIASYAGGGLSLFVGTVLIERSSIEANTSGSFGGGLLSYTYDPDESSPATSTMEISDSIISDNTTAGSGGGLYVEAASASCSGFSGTHNAGFLANEDAYGGGAVYLYDNGSFSSTLCDYGSDGSADDNAPYDISMSVGLSYEYESDESFVCNGSVCK